MTGKCKNKDIDNGPKKKKKKDGMVSRQQTGIHIRSDNTASLPPKDTLPYCYSRPTVPPHINPPSTYMHPPLEYTQPPPQVPLMMTTLGNATPQGYNVLPQEDNRPTSSVSRTNTHNPADSQPSSSSASQLMMSSLRIQGNSSEPNTPTTNQSDTPGHDNTQVGMRDMHNRLVINHEGYTYVFFKNYGMFIII